MNTITRKRPAPVVTVVTDDEDDGIGLASLIADAVVAALDAIGTMDDD